MIYKTKCAVVVRSDPNYLSKIVGVIPPDAEINVLYLCMGGKWGMTRDWNLNGYVDVTDLIITQKKDRIDIDLKGFMAKEEWESAFSIEADKKRRAINKGIRNSIKKVIFNPPATIIIWSNDEKTVAKCGPNDDWDPEKGFAMAALKHYMGKSNLGWFLRKYADAETANKEVEE